jgi:hypothetical protein
MEIKKRRDLKKNLISFIKLHETAMADITPPHYFGTSVSMVTPF